MREIKFRAWDGEANAWVVMLTLHMSGRLINLPPNIVLTQSTGLLDKNGKEIYEGDILLYRWPSGVGQNTYTAKIGYVLHPLDDYGDALPYTGVYFLEHESGKPISGHWHPQIEQLEIIGNLYETPELVESH